jgi:alkaline phosphatase D
MGRGLPQFVQEFCMKKYFIPLFVFAIAPSAWSATLKGSPVVGATGPDFSHILVQTSEKAQVRIEYWPQGSPATPLSSPTLTASEAQFWATTVPLQGLTPDTVYQYRVLIDEQPHTFSYATEFRTAPGPQSPLRDYSFATGSCFFVNDAAMNFFNVKYAGGFEIFSGVAAQKPELMLWTGDNVYMAPYDLGNIYSMNRRYMTTRAVPETFPVLAGMANFATWDDHDFGPNNADGSFPRKQESLQLFQTYWPNPGYGTPQTPGVFSKIRWGDVEFFLTDNRFHRQDKLGGMKEKAFLGQAQLKWLQEALSASTATFKIVVTGSPVLNEFYDESYIHYLYEYRQLMTFLQESRLPGVFLLSGDRHHSDLVKHTRPGLYPLYNYTSSPLTSSVTQVLTREERTNPERVPGSLLLERNFGMLRVQGPIGKRVLILEAYNTSGKKIWSHTLSQQELGVS